MNCSQFNLIFDVFFFFFLYSMDRNGTMTISWNEWSDYPVVPATENIPEIILYWKHSTVGNFPGVGLTDGEVCPDLLIATPPFLDSGLVYIAMGQFLCTCNGSVA